MDAYLGIVSLRAVHQYADRPVSEESLRRILEAGRATGSSQNRQQWTFYVVRKRSTLDSLAELVFAPSNLKGCQAAIAIVIPGRGTFDAGRCFQNMVLAAWNEGIGSSPNSARDQGAAAGLLGLAEGESIASIISLGYPLRPSTPREDDVDGILARIKRRPLEELVVGVDQ